MKCASLGGAGWCLNWTQIPFSMASFFFWSFSFTYFKKLSQLVGCIICSIHTLILLARILPLTCLFTIPVLPLRTFAGGIPFLNKVHSLDVYNITFLVDSHGCGQRNDFRLLKGIQKDASPLSLWIGHFGQYWKLKVCTYFHVLIWHPCLFGETSLHVFCIFLIGIFFTVEFWKFFTYSRRLVLCQICGFWIFYSTGSLNRLFAEKKFLILYFFLYR